MDDVNTFTTEDGLPANEGNGGVSLVDSKGRIWIGTVGGAAVFDPSHEIPKQAPSQLYIERTLVGDRPPHLPPRTLPHDQNHISFEYALLSFAREDGTRYRTQLVGLENEPGNWTTDAKRDFSSLQLEATPSKCGVKTRTITSVDQSWFHLPSSRHSREHGSFCLVFCLLAGLAFAVIRLRTNSLRRRNEWLGVELTNEQGTCREG